MGTIGKWWENNMKQVIATMYFDILSYTIGNMIFCILMNFELNLIIITARVYKLQLAEVKSFPLLNIFFISVTRIRKRFRPHKVYGEEEFPTP